MGDPIPNAYSSKLAQVNDSTPFDPRVCRLVYTSNGTMTTTRGKYVVAPMPLPTAWGAVKEELTSTSDEQHSDNKLVSDESKGVSVRDGDEIYGRPRHQSLVSMIASRLRVSLFESAHSRASSSTTISKRLSVVRESESAAYGSNQQPHVVIVNPKSDDGDDDDEDVVVESEEALHGYPPIR